MTMTVEGSGGGVVVAVEDEVEEDNGVRVSFGLRETEGEGRVVDRRAEETGGISGRGVRQGSGVGEGEGSGMGVSSGAGGDGSEAGVEPEGLAAA